MYGRTGFNNLKLFQHQLENTHTKHTLYMANIYCSMPWCKQIDPPDCYQTVNKSKDPSDVTFYRNRQENYL